MINILGVIALIVLFVLWIIVAIEISQGIGNSIKAINREEDEE